MAGAGELAAARNAAAACLSGVGTLRAVQRAVDAAFAMLPALDPARAPLFSLLLVRISLERTAEKTYTPIFRPGAAGQPEGRAGGRCMGPVANMD
jgi:hypothetical protein